VNKHWRKSEVEPHETVSIMGEPFAVGVHGGKTFLTHRQWSLMGSGPTPAEARASLKAEAEEIAEFYLSKSDETLTVEGVAIKKFLQKFLA